MSTSPCSQFKKLEQSPILTWEPGSPGFRLEAAQIQLPPSCGGAVERQGQGARCHQAGGPQMVDARLFGDDVRYIQIKKGELVLAEQPAVVVEDGGDLAASELYLN